MDVNFFGTVAVTKALLPLLKRTRGSRIINVSSVAGLGAGPMFGAYSASKHAVEGYAKCLRQELRPWGIQVANIHPGFMRTPMIEGAAAPTMAAFRAAPEDVRMQYPDAENMMKRMHDSVLSVGEDPRLVVETMLRLLNAQRPTLINLTGFQALFLGKVFFAMPASLQDFFSGLFVEVTAPRPDVLRHLQGGERDMNK
jgi:short-subunit dehydrogenase